MKALLVTLGLALLFALPAAAQRKAPRDEIKRSRERWEQKTPAERELLQKRYEAFRQLDRKSRHLLDERARRIADLEGELANGMSAEKRREMQRLARPQRERVLREQVKDELGARGRRSRDMLPEDVLREIQAAPPARRPFVVDALRKKHRPLDGEKVERMAREFGWSENEIKPLRGLPYDELERIALSLNRQRIDRHIAEHGPPPGLPAQEYERWKALPDEEFYARWQRLDPPPSYRSGHGRRPRQDLGAAARKRLESLHELRLLARPGMDERLELSELSPRARRAKLMQRTRARTLRFLEQSGLADAETLRGLRAASGQDYTSRLRRFCSDLEQELRRGGRAKDKDGRRDGRRDGRGPRPRRDVR